MADAATFLSVYPEFDNNAALDSLNFWMAQAQKQLALGRLGANADLAVYLYVAHNLALAQIRSNAANVGAAPGATTAPVASKSAGGLSVSYDVGAVIDPAAGPYNATSYGQELWKLLKMASRGGFFAPGRGSRPHAFGFPVRGGRW